MILSSTIFTSIDAIPEHLWKDLKSKDNVYFSPEFFRPYELAHQDMVFNYIFILEGTKAVAFAYTQLITISIKTITKNTRMPKWIRNALNQLFCKSPLKILFCGNVFLSGEYGISLEGTHHKIEALSNIADSIKSLSKSIPKLHALFIKDFYKESLETTNQFLCHNYASMRVEPNMIIYLNPKWKSFEDYKEALKSKYRVKANRADSKSQNLESKFFDITDIEMHIDALQILYQNTIENADFNAQILNLKTYIYLKSTFKDRFFVKGYFLNDRLVGFLSAMHNQNNLDAHFIGLDYGYNKSYAIYPRILNDYVRLGLSVGVTKINLGRTASEIKSTLGAQPENLTCYCRHKGYFPNLILKPFISNARVKTFKQHKPFK